MAEVVLALDLPSGREAIRLLDRLPEVRWVKVGSMVMTAEGPDLIRVLVDRGLQVFLDLKWHDIPNTVATAVEAATGLGAWMVNVHASGGAAMMRAAREAADNAAAKSGRQAPLVIAVTVLTSMNQAALREAGIVIDLMDQVLRLAELTKEVGLDGVVASPKETASIRSRCGPDFAIVTPGIRGGAAADAKNDQERTMSPAEAVKAGASYLVVGRPIIAAPDPKAAARAIVESLEATSP